MNLTQSTPLIYLRQFGQKNYLEYLRLLAYYGSRKRYAAHTVNFLGYHISVTDCLSFIFQFKDIFTKESYKFEAASESPIIFDCGANIGISCIYFKHLYPKARIIAFEADPAIAKLLESNLQQNKFSDIIVVPKAVWIHQEGVSFIADGADSGSIKEGIGNIHVPTARLKDYLSSSSLIDFLKIDIEGAECAVIQDCANVLKNVQNLFIEYHSWRHQKQELDQLLKVISNAGFRYYLEPVTKIVHPLFRRDQLQKMDIQINIFASRI